MLSLKNCYVLHKLLYKFCFLPSDICVTVQAVYKDASTENIIFSYNLLAVKSFTFFNCY